MAKVRRLLMISPKQVVTRMGVPDYEGLTLDILQPHMEQYAESKLASWLPGCKVLRVVHRPIQFKWQYEDENFLPLGTPRKWAFMYSDVYFEQPRRRNA